MICGWGHSVARKKKAFLPLKGVRVLSFEVAYSLPAGTRTLAELGAEVVRVVGPGRASTTFIGVVDGVFLSKPCIGLNLKSEEGLALAKQLIAKADVVCSNFTPTVMPSFGLTPEAMQEIRPGLIVLQLSGFGTPGPWMNYPAYGPSTEAAAGINALMARESDPPVRIGSGVFADQLGGRFAALSLLEALDHRNRTGEGKVIDVSMTEALTTLTGHFVVEAQLTGKTAGRPGNRDYNYAPQGVYPCAGDDNWIAITARTNKQWKRLVKVIGNRHLEDERFDTVERRWANHDEIDSVIAAWTSEREKHALATLLQEEGIAAGSVHDVSDPLFDPHLVARGLFTEVEHSEPLLGFLAHPHPTTPWVADGFERAGLGDIRFGGADNISVLKKWLGMKKGEVTALQESGVLLAPVPYGVKKPAALRVDPYYAEQLGLRRAEGATE